MNKKAAIIAGVAIVGLIGAFALSGKNKSQETEVKGTKSSSAVEFLNT